MRRIEDGRERGRQPGGHDDESTSHLIGGTPQIVKPSEIKGKSRSTSFRDKKEDGERVNYFAV